MVSQRWEKWKQEDNLRYGKMKLTAFPYRRKIARDRGKFDKRPLYNDTLKLEL